MGAAGTAMTGTYNLFLVALSIVVAVPASYAALDLAGRMTALKSSPAYSWRTQPLRFEAKSGLVWPELTALEDRS